MNEQKLLSMIDGVVPEEQKAFCVERGSVQIDRLLKHCAWIMSNAPTSRQQKLVYAWLRIANEDQAQKVSAA